MMAPESLPLRCYGKLPFDGGFLEYLRSSPASRALKKWIEIGHSEVERHREPGEDGRTGPAETESWRLLLASSAGDDLIAATMRPASDALPREHVFAVFVELRYRHYGGRFHSFLPAALARTWDALDSAWDTLCRAPSKSIFEQLLEEHVIPEPEDPREVRAILHRSRPAREARLLGGPESPLGEERRARVKEVARRITSGRDGLRALEVPVAEDLSEAAYDVSFWIESLNSQLLLRRLEPSVFLSTAPSRGSRRAVLVFSPLDEHDYAALTVGGSIGERFATPESVQSLASRGETGL